MAPAELLEDVVARTAFAGRVGRSGAALERVTLGDGLPEGVGHAVIDRWTEGEDTTAIVMRDLGDAVLTWENRLDARTCRWMTERIAALHRAYLGDPPDAVGQLTPALELFAPSHPDEVIGAHRRAAGPAYDDDSMRLGLLSALIWLGWNKTVDIVESPDEDVRERERASLAWWIEQARKAIERGAW